jgi:DNA-binding transcriptional regulator YdaS (Cro superfamily)
MPKRSLSEDELLAELSSACEAAGGQAHWAKTAGLSATYVSDVLKRRRQPGDSICRALGYERQYAYVRKDIWEQNKR